MLSAPSPAAPTRSSEALSNWGYHAVTHRFWGMSRRIPTTIAAEMVANVMSVGVQPGDKVAAGDTVMLLESMKMEIPVLAEAPGTVVAVKVASGDVVQEGDVLVELSA